MIMPLSKVQIFGPSYLLEDTLNLLKEKRIIHPEGDITTFCGDMKSHIKNYSVSEETVKERLFLEALRKKLEEFISLTEKISLEEGEYIAEDMELVSQEIDKNLFRVKELVKKIEENNNKIRELQLYSQFFLMAEEIIGKEKEPKLLELIGISLKSEEGIGRLKEILERKTEGVYSLVTKKLETGEILGIIFSSKDMKGSLRKELKELNVPELVIPPFFTTLSLKEKIDIGKEKILFLQEEAKSLKESLDSIVKSKKKLYVETLKEVENRLSKIKDRVYIYNSERVFFIFGWIPKERIKELLHEINERFKGYVIIEELKILDEEKERMPVIIVNPSYLKPFEVLTKIFPLPSYRSYDPTVFLGIFFPLFFGVIVGDIGYGIIICLLSLLGQRIFKKSFFARNILRVLNYGGIASIIFGFLYGEMLGEVGKRFYIVNALKIIDRGESIFQLFIVSVVIGISHIFIGFILNIFKPSEKKERFLSLALMVVLTLILATLYLFFIGGSQRILFLLLFLAGFIALFAIILYGIIFPLELIKTIGNIVSYGRIMAIGLSSVILANIANNFLDIMGNVFLGGLIAIFLHLTNVLLSTFSPTIHSLRLHYVEFFSKFMKFGGKKFNPL